MKNTQFRETREILTAQKLNVDPRFVQRLRPMMEAYLCRDMESSRVENEKNLPSGWFALKSKNFRNTRLLEKPEPKEDLVITDDPKWDMTQHWWDEEGPLISPDDEFINVIDLTSSVTRYGGWCSAGSIEHRDQMIFASQFPNCIGHVFIVDTPGGSAYAKNDYQQGIEAARAAGQPVISWIDGLCASAGVAATVQGDEIYVQHPECEFGCIGTMAAFYTIADGTKDETDGYVYHEKYDPESFEKNLEVRELANNDNPDPLLAELAEDGARFRELVRKCRPAASEEMLHGRIYKASDLFGIFIDGQKSFDEVIQRIVELHGGAQLIDHSVVDATVSPNEEPSPSPSPDACPEPDEQPQEYARPSVVAKGEAYDDTPCDMPSIRTLI